MSSQIYERRLAAALASKGVSLDPIYRMCLSLLQSQKLKGNLLEFGAGIGNLLKQLAASNLYTKITGADILPRPDDVPPEITWIQADLNEPVPVPDKAFDTIVSTEVIEHLENPRATFREFHRLLRPGGALLLTTPNQESIRSLVSLIFGRHFAAFQDASYPAHITALIRKDFERICAESGFIPPRFFYTNAGGIPKLPHIRWQQVSFGLLRGRLFSDNIAVVTTKA